MHPVEIIAGPDPAIQRQITPVPYASSFFHNEERFLRMIEEVEDYAIILLDDKGNIQTWNSGAQKIKGYREEEVLGKNFRIFYRQEDQDSRLPEQLITEAALKGRALHEGWRLRKDGSTFWGSIVITSLHDSEHNIIGFSKLTRDLTERKLSEDQLLLNSRHLETQNKELQQFAYIASHDMKEPLRKVLLYNHLLQERLGSRLDQQEELYLQRSINAANRMQQLIEDLLTYSRTVYFPDLFSTVDLNEVLLEVLNFHEDQLLEIGADVRTTTLPKVQGIYFQLRQLLDNLVTNALKYRHPERTLQISISTGFERLHMPETENSSIEQEYYKISLADNGIGFNMEYSETIFGLFQRLVPRNEYSGTGIGLAICKKIVQHHKGMIRATGKEQEGAVFDIYLPAVVR